MSWSYDPFKPMSEKTPADWATDYYIYEQVMGEDEDDFGSGGAKPPKPPKEPKHPSDDGDTVGCAKAIICQHRIRFVPKHRPKLTHETPGSKHRK